MRKQMVSITEPTYPVNPSPYPRLIKESRSIVSLPKISNISNSLNRGFSYKKIYDRKPILKPLNQKRLITARSLNKKKFKINKDLDMIYKLNMENEVDQIFQEDLKLKKEKEKIDNSKEVREKRLNIYKPNPENKNEKKMEVDSKEKEKYIENAFKEELEKLEKIKYECNLINAEVNQIRDDIDEHKLELNVYDNYGDYLDKKYLKKLKEKEMEKKLDMLNNNEIIEEKDENAENEEESNNNLETGNGDTENGKKTKREKFEHINAFSKMKKQREDRITYLNKDIKAKEEQLIDLEEKQNSLIAQCKELKGEIYKLRQQLLNIYHINLYEGLNFRTDGLPTLIRAIWNLGVNVDINYMPTYLDNESIDYLFERTKRLIEISKMRQVIEENKKEFEVNLKKWKQINVNEDSKNTDSKTDSNFFQTGVMEKYNYLDKYPKSKQFMEDYNKKYFPKNDKIEIKLKQKHEFKSLNIPYGIIDKYNKVEKLKYLLKNLVEQNERKEKREIERLCKEFMNNNYEEKYKVSFETLMGALCGEEKKNDGINFFTKFQREYKEGKRLIEFHTNINMQK